MDKIVITHPAMQHKEAAEAVLAGRFNGLKTRIMRVTGAMARALLVMILVVTPSAILPGIAMDDRQIVALIALFAAALTFAEYNSTYPSLLQFRDAPPFNRLRFLMLFLILLILSVLGGKGVEASPISLLSQAIAHEIGNALDFPLSPVNLVVMAFADTGLPEHEELIRSAAGMACFIALFSVLISVLFFRIKAWPLQERVFNIWINLPTFEPSAGGDIVRRLRRSACINLALGFLLPFAIPKVAALGLQGILPSGMLSPHIVVWIISLWAFYPANLLLRGAAMWRIAGLIRAWRAEHSSAAPASSAPE